MKYEVNFSQYIACVNFTYSPPVTIRSKNLVRFVGIVIDDATTIIILIWSHSLKCKSDTDTIIVIIIIIILFVLQVWCLLKNQLIYCFLGNWYCLKQWKSTEGKIHYKNVYNHRNWSVLHIFALYYPLHSFATLLSARISFPACILYSNTLNQLKNCKY